MKKLMVYMAAFVGMSSLIGSQIDPEIKGSAAYRELARVLYSVGFPTVLVGEVAGMLLIDAGSVDTQGGYTEHVYSDDRSVSVNDDLTIEVSELLRREDSQKLPERVAKLGAHTIELLGGYLASFTKDQTLVCSLSSGVNCMKALYRGTVAAGYSSGDIVVFNPLLGNRLKEFSSDSGVSALGELPSKDIVSGHEDGTVQVFDHETLQCIQKFTAHDGGIIYVAYIPGMGLFVLGKDRVSGKNGRVAKIWAMKKRLDIIEGTQSILSSSSSAADASSSSNVTSSEKQV